MPGPPPAAPAPASETAPAPAPAPHAHLEPVLGHPSPVPAASADPGRWGRVDAEGTIYVRTADGERIVGSWQAGAPEEGLAHFARRFDDMLTEVELIANRLAAGGGDPKHALSSAKTLRDGLDEATVVGDLAGLRARLDDLVTQADAAVGAARAARDAQRAASVARKEALAAEAEALAAEATQWKQAGDRFKTILDEWRTIRGIDRKTDEQLWKRFAKAREAFNRRRGSHFADLDRQRASAKTRKEELILEAEKLSESDDWGPTAARFRELMAEWKAAGRAQKDTDDALWQRFRTAQDAFFARRSGSFAERDAEFAANAEAKKALLTEAEKIETSRPERRQGGPARHPGALGGDRQGPARRHPAPGGAAAGGRGEGARGRRPAVAPHGSRGRGPGGAVPRARGAVRGAGAEGARGGRQPAGGAGREPGRPVAGVARDGGAGGAAALTGFSIARSAATDRRRQHLRRPACASVTVCCDQGRRGGQRRPAMRTQLTASVITASTARIMPGPGAVRPYGTPTCRDQIAHSPVTTEIPQPTAASHASPHHRVASASAETTSPKPSEVNAKSGGSSPSGASPREHLPARRGAGPRQDQAHDQHEHRDRDDHRGRPGVDPAFAAARRPRQLLVEGCELVGHLRLVHRSPVHQTLAPQPCSAATGAFGTPKAGRPSPVGAPPGRVPDSWTSPARVRRCVRTGPSATRWCGAP